MFALVDRGRAADIFVPAGESSAVALAAADLASDIERVGSRRPVVKRFVPREEAAFLLIGTIGTPEFDATLASRGLDVSAIDGGFERYVVRTFGENHENLLVAGSDARGTMWGIYHLSEQLLGVDPVYLWTGNQPRRRERIEVGPIDLVSDEPDFRFRGWFLNDEDLLTEWRNGGGRRYIDYPFYHQVIHQDVLARVIETALRLRQNMMIPASFVDIMNPAEENLVRMVSERGLFVTQHHVEPLGVSHFAWDNYWADRGRKIPCSFVTEREAHIEIWRDYVERWARYPNVIWQLGLRGRGDRPVWFHDDAVPASDAERGALISDAYAAQHAIVADVLGTTDFPSTTTLWMEGSHLQRDGHLDFPPGVTIVFADLGSSQMMQDDFDHTERRDEHTYGVYHHVCFWGDGPHLAQGTSIGKLAHNYRRADEKGDTHYSILNVSNVREVILGAEAVAELTWDARGFDPAGFLDRWFTREFGDAAAPAVRDAYDAYFGAYHVMRDERRPDEMLLIDGMTRRLGLKLLDILEGSHEESNLGYYRHLDDFDSTDAFLSYFADALSAADARWRRAQQALYEALPAVTEERRAYFTDHFIVQYDTIVGLYRWAHLLAQAAVAVRNGDSSASPAGGAAPAPAASGPAALVDAAASALEKALIDRRKAEHGAFAHWYRGDRKMNLPRVLQRTRELAADLRQRTAAP